MVSRKRNDCQLPTPIWKRKELENTYAEQFHDRKKWKIELTKSIHERDMTEDREKAWAEKIEKIKNLKNDKFGEKKRLIGLIE